jgi:hypothetical protein
MFMNAIQRLSSNSINASSPLYTSITDLKMMEMVKKMKNIITREMNMDLPPSAKKFSMAYCSRSFRVCLVPLSDLFFIQGPP